MNKTCYYSAILLLELNIAFACMIDYCSLVMKYEQCKIRIIAMHLAISSARESINRNQSTEN